QNDIFTSVHITQIQSASLINEMGGYAVIRTLPAESLLFQQAEVFEPVDVVGVDQDAVNENLLVRMTSLACGQVAVRCLDPHDGVWHHRLKHRGMHLPLLD